MGLYFCWRSWTSCLDTWHHGFYQIDTKINKWQSHLEILEWAMFGPSNCTIIQTQTLKTTQKWVTEHKTKLLLWPFQSSDLNPIDEWTEEKKHHHGAVNLKDLERFWMKEWSLISCQEFSNLIRHYRRPIWAVKLANGGLKQYWIKGCR